MTDASGRVIELVMPPDGRPLNLSRAQQRD